MDRIEENTRVRRSVLSYFFAPGDINKNTIRKIVGAIEKTDSSIIRHIEAQTKSGMKVVLHDGILRIIAILRKMEVSDEDIKSKILNAIRNEKANRDGVYAYLAPYMAYLLHKNVYTHVRIKRGGAISSNTISVDDFRLDGTAEIGTWAGHGDYANVDNDLAKFTDKILNLVTV